jgi:calcitonin receptor-like
MAHKICTEEGTWFRHPQSNLIWSNYTTCVDVEDLEVQYLQINSIWTFFKVKRGSYYCAAF